MPKVLLVEDNPKVRKALSKILTGSGYFASEITKFHNYDEIIMDIQRINPDLVLLDLGLAELSGLELLRHLRAESNIPVIILTGNIAESNELLAMGFGADDYILKPYRSAILILRIAAVLRRTQHNDASKKINYQEATIDLGKGIIERKNSGQLKKVYLTKNEMIVLRCLLENRGEIVRRGLLMEELWNNQEYINDNALTVNVSRLREKFQKVGLGSCIETRKGLGYILL